MNGEGQVRGGIDGTPGSLVVLLLLVAGVRAGVRRLGGRAALVRHARARRAAALPDGSRDAIPAAASRTSRTTRSAARSQDIQSRSRGRMKVRGDRQVGDRPGHVRRRHQPRCARAQEKRDYLDWLGVRALMLDEPIAAQKLLGRLGDDIKVPVFIQGGIHGNEYEGVDAAIDTIEKFATTPYGTDPEIDAILSHTILVFNPIQNPDGRDRRHARERQRVRPQPRLPHAVAVGDARVGQLDEEVARARDARHARLRDADADRGDDQAAQPEHRVRHSG